ncbi:MAG: hypothetical protein FWE61_03625 [Micrococcales bacterium]|nr:hypothetical protein [Micrococcales bacterium]
MRHLVAVAAAVLALAGCAQADNPSTPASPVGPVEPTELASCLVGTWDLDVGFFEEMLLESTRASMRRDGLDGSVSSTRFSAVQTTTFAADGTFSTQLPMSMEMTMVLMGHPLPTTYDATSSGTGTWSAGTTTLSTTFADRGIEQQMIMAGEPVEVALGPLLLLPDVPTPVVCDGSTITVELDTDDVDPHFPEVLVFTRQP